MIIDKSQVQDINSIFRLEFFKEFYGTCPYFEVVYGGWSRSMLENDDQKLMIITIGV